MRAVLLHWKKEEGESRLAKLHAAGWEAEHLFEMSPAILKGIASKPPDAIVIDLSRLPSHGKLMARACLERKTLRAVPLVYVEGDPEKVDSIREIYPAATYTTWSRIKSALRSAVSRKPALPPPPLPPLTYQTPLPKKLGILGDVEVLLLDAPAGFESTLGTLPAGTQILRDCAGPASVVIQFVRSRSDLVDTFGRAGQALAPRGKLWIAYPKRTSGLASDLTQEFLREYALTRSWVDYKVCAIDSTWTGFCFSRRKA